MPNPKAKAAFNRAQQLAAEMRDVHAQEPALSAAIDRMTDQASREALESEYVRTCSEWTRLFGEYTKAFAEFTAAVEEARKP